MKNEHHPSPRNFKAKTAPIYVVIVWNTSQCVSFKYSPVDIVIRKYFAVVVGSDLISLEINLEIPLGDEKLAG